MQRIKQTILSIFILVALWILFSGCTANRINLVEQGAVSLVMVQSKMITISKAYVYQDVDVLEVSGNVKRRDSSIGNWGHVDISVINPGNEIVDQVSTRYYPGIIRRRGARESFFTARLTAIPPKGSIVRVAYHEAVKSGNGVFDCGQNAAEIGR
ncbi:MAG: hypothetical protein AABY87_13820 [bacterium]